MVTKSLVPKPQDWGLEINIAGFIFLELASSFKPPEALTEFLDTGPPPIYIGFGNIVINDLDKFTNSSSKRSEWPASVLSSAKDGTASATKTTPGQHLYAKEHAARLALPARERRSAPRGRRHDGHRPQVRRADRDRPLIRRPAHLGLNGQQGESGRTSVSHRRNSLQSAWLMA